MERWSARLCAAILGDCSPLPRDAGLPRGRRRDGHKALGYGVSCQRARGPRLRLITLTRNTFILVALLPLIYSVAAVAPALAENLGPGGGSRVITGDQIVGPSRVWLTISPEPAQVGTLTFDVRLTDPQSGKRITDADIRVTLTNPDDGSKLTHAVTHHDAGNPIDYAAHVDVPSAGSWSGVLQVSGAAGSAQIEFVEPVLSPRSSSTLVVIGLPFLALLCLLAGVWYWRGHAAGRAARPA
ncbi:MAG TPA: FixH family protein [Anaerolineae bacterium]